MSLLDSSDKAAILDELFDKSKIVLTCHKHSYAYGQKRPPNFNCPDCAMVDYLGLIINTPPARRLEVLEMLEYSAHKLVESARSGELARMKFFKRPEVTVDKDAL